MLPNHAALAVAEQFGMLEALHPGRIDLGIGRAPGTDPVTAAALRRGPSMLGADDFPEQMTELLGYFDGSLPAGHPYEHITAVPARGYKPAVWMLGLEHLRRVTRPPCSGCRTRSPTTSPRRCSTTRSRSTAARSGPSPSSTRPT